MNSVKTHLFVISDLHLGGPPVQDGRPALQICSATGRRRLVAFVDWVKAQKSAGEEIQLVIAGDIVDFLAESRPSGYRPFTADDQEARKKLSVIIGDTREIWDAFQRATKEGVALTLMLGNHDVELSLPGPRRLLLDQVGPGRVEFIYDNQAFTVGPVLIEHGNRYDDWNAVWHDKLREARSLISRRQSSAFEPLPGSKMVIDLVNPLKEHFGFVDLLKPETAALLPFLAFLDPNRFQDIITSLKNQVRAARLRRDPGQQPKDSDFVAAARNAPPSGLPDPLDVAASTGDAEDDALITLAQTIAGGGDAAMVGAVSTFFERWRGRLSDEYKNIQLGLLYRALRAFSGSNHQAFDVNHEEEIYLKGATESAARGFQVIVYGHTHLPKRISLRGRKSADGKTVGSDALYLNSGTWADLMAVPSAVLEGKDEMSARSALETFAGDIALNRIDAWRRTNPTFVQIELEGGNLRDAQLLFFGGERAIEPVTTERLRSRMEGKTT